MEIVISESIGYLISGEQVSSRILPANCVHRHNRVLAAGPRHIHEALFRRLAGRPIRMPGRDEFERAYALLLRFLGVVLPHFPPLLLAKLQ